MQTGRGPSLLPPQRLFLHFYSLSRMLTTEVITTRDQLSDLWQQWEALPRPSVMQSPAWLLTWWDAYGAPGRELSVVAVRDGETLVGLAPWYAESKRGGRHLQWLGDGRACSDHATFLCHPDYQTDVVEAIADWLLDEPVEQWQQVTLDSVDEGDEGVSRVIARLAEQGCPVSYKSEPGSCYIDLPESWEAMLMSVSKNHRKKCRRLERKYFDTGRATIQTLRTPGECSAAFDLLVRLHNDRRDALGDRGAFEEPGFLAFHRSVIEELAKEGQVEIRVVSIDGQAVAAEYLLEENGIQYAYQGGLSAEGEEMSAGSLSLVALVRDAIEAGHRRLDLLRGVEAYKFSWGVKHRPAQSVLLRRRNVAGLAGAWCDKARSSAKQMKQRLLGSSAEG